MVIHNWFFIDWKKEKTAIVLIIWVLLVLFHNFVYRVWRVEDLISFYLTVLVIPAYFLISVLYSLIYVVVKKARKKKR